jgi:ATP-dependent Clp protease ATP-binding subunit ClpC
MFEQFTESLVMTIMRAQEEAGQAGHNYVAPEQLLLGLLSIGTGVAYKVLTRANVTLLAARKEILAIEPKGHDRIAIEIPFTAAAKRVLELTLDEARKANSKAIDTEHLLLAILREGDSVGVQALRNLSVDLAKLRSDLLESSK